MAKRKPKKQSSPELSSLAAFIMGCDDAEMDMMATGPKRLEFYAQIRSLAASVLSQDETPEPIGGWTFEPEIADIASPNTVEGT